MVFVMESEPTLVTNEDLPAEPDRPGLYPVAAWLATRASPAALILDRASC